MQTITLARPERDEELRIEAESQATAGSRAYPDDTTDGTAWSIQEDPDLGAVFVLRRGDFSVADQGTELTGDDGQDAVRAAARWRKMSRYLDRGITAYRERT